MTTRGHCLETSVMAPRVIRATIHCLRNHYRDIGNDLFGIGAIASRPADTRCAHGNRCPRDVCNKSSDR